MLLVFGVAGISLAVLALALVIVGARRPDPSRWVGDFWVSSIYVPAIITVGVLGVAALVKLTLVFDAGSVRFAHWMAAAGIAGAAVVLYRLIGVRRRLAAYAAAMPAGDLVDFPRPDGEKPPARPAGGPRKRAA
jgi:hypothetical protein